MNIAMDVSVIALSAWQVIDVAQDSGVRITEFARYDRDACKRPQSCAIASSQTLKLLVDRIPRATGSVQLYGTW